MKQPKQCPKCGQFKVVSGRTMIIIVGIAFIVAAPIASFISFFLIGPFAFLVFILMAGFGVLFLLGGTMVAMTKFLPKKYRQKKELYICNNCQYQWQEPERTS